MSEKTADSKNAPAVKPHPDEKLYAPVLPPWGSMFPTNPPENYGDISFDPSKPSPDLDDSSEPSEKDKKAYELLLSLFPSRRT
jgi:hypothetical protein